MYVSKSNIFAFVLETLEDEYDKLITNPMHCFSKKNEIDVNSFLGLSFLSVKLVFGIDEIFSTLLTV